MANLNVAIKKAELNKFYKILILLVKIFIIPILLVSILCSICFLSTKLNGNIPTLFNSSIITINKDIDNFKEGERVGVSRVDFSEIKVGDYVAYFEPIEEEAKNGSQVLFNKVAEITINPETNEPIVAFEGESYYVVKNAIIGRFVEKSNFAKTSIMFFSSRYTLVFLDLLPLTLLLIALTIYIIEVKNVEKINQELVAFQMEKEMQKQNIEQNNQTTKKQQMADDKTLQNITENKPVENLSKETQTILPQKPLPAKPESKTIQKEITHRQSIPPKAPLKKENITKNEDKFDKSSLEKNLNKTAKQPVYNSTEKTKDKKHVKSSLNVIKNGKDSHGAPVGKPPRRPPAGN